MISMGLRFGMRCPSTVRMRQDGSDADLRWYAVNIGNRATGRPVGVDHRRRAAFGPTEWS